ncbi:MAG: hypothetical protein H3C34_08360 [Caldilineaceae bacterium]|nr:hypothetical protein [Caldilineaceae bacterium]
MLSESMFLYGEDKALPDRVPLRAGPLELIWEAGDLRTIKFAGVEVLRRIYVAIRDRNWGTVPNVLDNVRMDVGPDTFEIQFDASNREGPIDFTWQGRIAGTANGEITVAMAGQANTTFWKSRIGFCVLHPAAAAGCACKVEHVDGTFDEVPLPVLIDPDQPVQPFAEMVAITHEVMPGVWFETRFRGDIFEMEDQRNWTDASFKIFSTPLRIPYPVELQAGTQVTQSLTLRVHDLRPESRPAILAEDGPGLHFGPAGDAVPITLPRIGLGMATHHEAPTTQQIAWLAALNPDHLRVDLRPAAPDASARLADASKLAQALDIGLHVAVFLGEPYASQLDALAAILNTVRPPVLAWLAFPAQESFQGGSPTGQVLELVSPILKRYADVPLGSGTDVDFIFLQRNVPPLHAVDFVTFAINPQVHAFDNTSLTETLACQAMTVQSAGHLANGGPVHVSPVTLRMRYNPYATAAPPPTAPDRLPPQVDVRQMSLFGAGWTLGSVKYLAEGGAASVTYYETTGWRGVMERATGSPAADKFRSLPGAVFPLYHILADVGELSPWQVIPSRSTDPLAVDGLILEDSGRRSCLLANFTPSAQTVTVNGLRGTVQVRVLDASNVEQAMRAPQEFRAAPPRPLHAVEGAYPITLSPFALARLDTCAH